VSIDLESLRMLGASTLAPDADETAASERAVFSRPEFANASPVRPRAASRRRSHRPAVVALALVAVGGLCTVPAFGVQQRVRDLFFGSPAPSSVREALAHASGFTALPARGVIEAESSKGPMKLYFAGASDPSGDGCVVQEVPYGVGGTTCGPATDWFTLPLVGGLQNGTDNEGHSFTFAAGRFNAPAVSARFVYAHGDVVPLQSYRGWYIAEPGSGLVALEAVDAGGAVIARQPMSDLTHDPFDPETLIPAATPRPLITIAYPGHSDAVLSVGRTAAGTDGAWLTIDGLRQPAYSSTDRGKSVIQAWSYPGLSFVHGFARPSATRAVISFQDGSQADVRIVHQFFLYRVTPANLVRGHRPVAFKILDANGRVLDQVTQRTLNELSP
jgi:hypothetical protein